MLKTQNCLLRDCLKGKGTYYCDDGRCTRVEIAAVPYGRIIAIFDHLLISIFNFGLSRVKLLERIVILIVRAERFSSRDNWLEPIQDGSPRLFHCSFPSRRDGTVSDDAIGFSMASKDKFCCSKPSRPPVTRSQQFIFSKRQWRRGLATTDTVTNVDFHY